MCEIHLDEVLQGTSAKLLETHVDIRWMSYDSGGIVGLAGRLAGSENLEVRLAGEESPEKQGLPRQGQKILPGRGKTTSLSNLNKTTRQGTIEEVREQLA